MSIRRYGAPEAIVTDGGGIFYSTVALELYEMLGIRKERIDATTRTGPAEESGKDRRAGTATLAARRERDRLGPVLQISKLL